ncbi:hypothetical protein [Gordonia sp. SND2]|uniref:hypothetical protein n=1 Tax=Gordonia sp. SND2 TaxID=3388659 RepID=UPI00398AE38C
MDSTYQPRATGTESQLLDHIDILTAAAGNRPDEAADILEESTSVDRRLAESREASWLAWAHRIGLFDLYEATMRAQEAR